MSVLVLIDVVRFLKASRRTSPCPLDIFPTGFRTRYKVFPCRTVPAE